MPHIAPSYTGRFAPSPSGPLHFGSLVAALASYLDARHNCGRWLVRIDDIDPPREQAGAADLILQTLEAHGLHWDDTVLWQSQRREAYRELLATLEQKDLIYPCDCTRQDVKAMGGIYNGHCRHARPRHGNTAWRLKLYDLPGVLAKLPDTLSFTDALAGVQQQNLAREVGDAVVVRKDGLFGYQLAVVADDIHQGITHVVRGSDLLPVTARQIRFFEILQQRTPIYAHVPVACGADGRKLSKQNQAAALDNRNACANLWQALVFLRQNPPRELAHSDCASLLHWATQHWRLNALAGVPLSTNMENT
ncbi:tRNA glutamyl-Q(34) synthetase GluQRS [Gilvimarinus sp. DA14]|uniref:tRNA glutamyl-Q(34) synthetase GluQRS n=1 Tax=Gilvimarinus sp. DA14 TaxID=2956798 RepID=UPI0020B6BC13|nr:tRNA glutamyl-Q(34) synthetase GluQRS [Gilvimarinus sp. DA14]UTF59958.1 tRNA glutamyl-Q(34) synthetase GluQRS [Gilvimarinus sp. DA14]